MRSPNGCSAFLPNQNQSGDGYAFDHDLLIRMLPSDHRRSIISAMKKRRNGTLEFPSSINNGKELPPLSDI
jgi:hypothetical protein